MILLATWVWTFSNLQKVDPLRIFFFSKETLVCASWRQTWINLREIGKYSGARNVFNTAVPLISQDT